jgi:hypothetical protein
MPIYVFRCECGQVQEVFRHHPDSPRRGPRCSCGKTPRRSFRDETVHAETDWTEPLLSESMGVMPNQVAEHRRRFPDINMTDDGRVIIKSRAEKRRVMKTLGFHELS